MTSGISEKIYLHIFFLYFFYNKCGKHVFVFIPIQIKYRNVFKLCISPDKSRWNYNHHDDKFNPFFCIFGISDIRDGLHLKCSNKKKFMETLLMRIILNCTHCVWFYSGPHASSSASAHFSSTLFEIKII